MALGEAWSLWRAPEVTFVAGGGMVQPGGHQDRRSCELGEVAVGAEASTVTAKNGQGGRRGLGVLVSYYVEWG